MLTFLKDLFRQDRRQPEFDINDPRHPVNVGWRRVDLRRGRHRVRFWLTVADFPKVAPPHPEFTNREFMGGVR